FHNTGMPQRFDSPLDIGRQSVVAKVKRQEFGCLGEYSDAEKNECPHVTYMSLSMERAMGTFRTPSLRQISKKTIYGHAGQFQTLYDVVYHYNKAPSDVRGNLTGQGNLSEILPLDLSDQDIADIVAFLSII
ncbi:MAG: hypothetical protein ABF283_07665, partial [Planktotalea arctica]